jgi:hypothetical protein
MYRPIAGSEYNHHYCLRCGQFFTTPLGIERMSHCCEGSVTELVRLFSRARHTQPRPRSVKVKKGRRS